MVRLLQAHKRSFCCESAASPLTGSITVQRRASTMLALPATLRPVGLRPLSIVSQGARPRRAISTVVRASASDDVGTAGKAAIALGLVANPIVLWSEWTLKTTGSGLPPGPGGVLGAAEGLGYLVVLGVVGWSAYTKATTGSGLPAGPSGLLGAVEGFSYLSLLAGIIVFALEFAEKGSIPGILG